MIKAKGGIGLAFALIGGVLADLLWGNAITRANEPERFDFSSFAAPGYAEDIIAVPDTPWVIVSRMDGAGKPGGLSAVDRRTRHIVTLLAESGVQANWDRSSYPDCAGPVEPRAQAMHGINLSVDQARKVTLFVIRHGTRRSIEVFDLNVTGERPQLTWTGCVRAPSGTYFNAVAPLANRALVATNTFNPEDPAEPRKSLGGAAGGDVHRWDRASGWRVISPKLPTPNGIVATPDGKSLLVALWTQRRVIRIPVDGGEPEASVEVPFQPDNLRWDDVNTRVLSTGQLVSAPEVIKCAMREGECQGGFIVSAIDPRAMTANTVHAMTEASFPFGMTTVAAPVGEEIWLGNIASDAIGRLVPRP